MFRRFHGACAALVAAAAAWPPAAPQQFRAGTDLVHVPVIVTGRDNRVVRGLARDDFVLLEDGRPQRIAIFADGEAGSGLPLFLGLLLDRSGSMAMDLSEAGEAVIRFVKDVDEAVDVTFVEFDAGVRVGRYTPSNYPYLFDRVRGLRDAGGFTALYDAIGLYLQGTLDRAGQHVLVLYTDGGDTMSSTSFNRLQEMLRLTDVLVYAVGYLRHQTQASRTWQQVRLQQIAGETGGRAFFPTAASEIDRIYAAIRDEVAGRYTLGYVPENRTADGRFRRIEVRLAGGSARGARVRARTGYYAPAAR